MAMKKLNLTFALIILVALLASCNCNNCPEEEDETPYINYPETGYFGDNLLDTSRTDLPTGKASLAAELSEGASLKVVITSLDTNQKTWGVAGINMLNWFMHPADFTAKSQTFESMNSFGKCDLGITPEATKIKIDFYEMGDEQPTFTKIYD